MLQARPQLAQLREQARTVNARSAPGADRTGLPDRLKQGVEALSGYSMDGVRVHYGSAEPARVGALAFARGSDIHLAPGQERHLPHEAWHVVQQKQGRVRPTMQAKGVDINDETALEREADAMGAAAAARGDEAAAPSRRAVRAQTGGPVQRMLPVPLAAAPAAAAAAAPVYWKADYLNAQIQNQIAPTFGAATGWASAAWPPPNAEIGIRLENHPHVADHWLQIHAHWGATHKWWSDAPDFNLKQGAAQEGLILPNTHLHLWSAANHRMKLGAQGSEPMRILQKYDSPTVTVNLLQDLLARLVVNGVANNAIHYDLLILHGGSTWLPWASLPAPVRAAWQDPEPILNAAAAAAAAAAAPVVPALPAAAAPAAAAASASAAASTSVGATTTSAATGTGTK